MPYETDLESERRHLRRSPEDQARLGERIERADDAASTVRDGPVERAFTDKRGRPMSMRTEDADAASLRRAESQDTQSTSHAIRLRTSHEGHEASRANLTLEIERQYNPANDHYDRVGSRRMRINDIETHPTYRGSGIAGEQAREAERIAQRAGADELYGALSFKAEEEAQVRGFYQSKGYGFRPLQGGGEEVYKRLQR